MGHEGRGRLALGLAVALLTAPAQAAIPATATPGASTAPLDAEAALAQASDRVHRHDCRGALLLLDRLVSDAPAQAASRVSAQMMRLPCLAQAGRGAEIPAVLAELKTTAPGNPAVQGYQILFDVDDGRFAAAADGLVGLAGDQPAALAMIPGTLWRVVSTQLTQAGDYDRRDRAALALARARWQPADEPDLSDAIVVDGIGALMPHGDADEARDLLDRIDRPELLWQMAIERRYAPIWPAIEARLGAAGGAAADRYARAALAAYANGPADAHATRDATRAFLALGRYDDAVATAASVSVRPGMSEADVSTVEAAARALAASGDRKGQMARLAPFATLDLKTAPDAAEALIDLAEALDEAGRYDEELALARTAMADKRPFYSPYGIAWLQRSETCALSGAGRVAEARASADTLKAAAPDSPAAAVEGLLCAGRDAEAARIAIDALASPEGTDRIADQFQPSGALYAPVESRLGAQWARLLARPDVRSAFDKSARILPRPLWPARQPRAVPALPGAGDSGTTT